MGAGRAHAAQQGGRKARTDEQDTDSSQHMAPPIHIRFSVNCLLLWYRGRRFSTLLEIYRDRSAGAAIEATQRFFLQLIDAYTPA
jgi:hypothetical protein